MNEYINDLSCKETPMEMKKLAAKESQLGPGERKLSVMAGGFLSGLAAILKGWRLPLAFGGGYLLYRGLSGRCYVYQLARIRRGKDGFSGIREEQAITIDRPIEDVYQFLQDFKNWPLLIPDIQLIHLIDDTQSRWQVKSLLGTTLIWDIVVEQQKENAFIIWRSLPGASIPLGVKVAFFMAPGQQGTEVHLLLEYHPPLGSGGAFFLKLLQKDPAQKLREALRLLKQWLEAGELSTAQHQRAADEGQGTEGGSALGVRGDGHRPSRSTGGKQ
jgi:uncharacterized membrane protein